MDVHGESLFAQALGAFGADFDIRRVRLLEMFRHGRHAFRAVDLERLPAPHNPRSEDYIRVSKGVVGVEMSEEEAGQVGRIERSHRKLLGRRFSPADNTGAGIEQIGLAVDHHRDRRTGTGGIGNRRARAEYDHLRAFGRRGGKRHRQKPPKTIRIRESFDRGTGCTFRVSVSGAGCRMYRSRPGLTFRRSSMKNPSASTPASRGAGCR